MLYDDSTAGQTFELYGPRQYSMAQIAELVDREIYKKRRHINLPKPILQPLAELINRVLWWDTGLSRDQVEREFHDQVIDPTAKTFKDLGMEPTDISKWTYHYLVRSLPFSGRLYFADPISSSRTARQHTTIFLRRRKRRCGKSGSTFTCWTTSKRQLAGESEMAAGWGRWCCRVYIQT